MKKNIVFIVIFSLLFSLQSCSSEKPQGSYYSGEYQNLFVEFLGKSQAEVDEKINAAFNQLFYGNDSTERVYYPVEPDMAYILDVIHKDVRSEGMSYGMMIAAQLDKKEEFDRLWKWTKTFMQHKEEPHKNYFAWQLSTDGKIIDSTSASDGEEWFATALFLASARWGDSEGIYNYKNEAQKILDAMLYKDESGDSIIVNMFNKDEKKVVFVPEIQAAYFTDPSYHLPHFYELWGRWADKDNQFWCDAADTSRAFLKRAAHPETGLSPDYAEFDGTPYNPWGGGNHNFQYDAWRVAMNIAVDYQWFNKNEWAVKQSDNLLNFFYKEGIHDYGNLYTLDGKKLGNDHSPGLVAMNAVAALAASVEIKKNFIEELWDLPVPSGFGRYYDGMLYMLGLLQTSGNFRIYNSGSTPVSSCSGD